MCQGSVPSTDLLGRIQASRHFVGSGCMLRTLLVDALPSKERWWHIVFVLSVWTILRTHLDGKRGPRADKNALIAISIMLAYRTVGIFHIQIKAAGPSPWSCQGSLIISHQSSVIISRLARDRRDIGLVMPCSNTRNHRYS